MSVKLGGETHKRFKKYYSILTPEIFCERFGYRNPAVVRQMASVLGVTHKRKPKPWTQEEITELKSHWHLRGYHTYTNLQRSRGAILIKARRLRRNETSERQETLPSRQR